MAELVRSGTAPRTQSASVRIGRVAERQWGVVSRAQLLRCGLSPAGIKRRIADERLHPVHPGVYAVGHRALSAEGRLAAALLHAGPGAALSHLTAAWWWQLLSREPSRIHVSTCRRVSSLQAVFVHHPRHLERTSHRGLPVTTVPRTLLDCASMLPPPALRRALSEALYLRIATPSAIAAQLRRGHRGSAPLRAALTRHTPQLARTLSVLEERFLALCEQFEIPDPEVNGKVGGLMVDALWRAQRVVVELDGHAAHANPAAVERDRRRELALRGAGYYVLRYTWQQVTEHPDEVAADLRALLRGRGLTP
jgi:predicted transcriptional regulator of viral defense system